uniref:Uncharacterized protein n=1 Tax=Caenorhabditis japonica TaxID=281687 RepID=A0A8R1IH94_CAEJA
MSLAYFRVCEDVTYPPKEFVNFPVRLDNVERLADGVVEPAWGSKTDPNCLKEYDPSVTEFTEEVSSKPIAGRMPKTHRCRHAIACLIVKPSGKSKGKRFACKAIEWDATPHF